MTDNPTYRPPICEAASRSSPEPRAEWAAEPRWRLASRRNSLLHGPQHAGQETTAREPTKPGSPAAKKALPADYYANRPETIEETAELVTARGGKGIAVVWITWSRRESRS